jgi:solute carrier family 7 (cationic amino acid transporter), member 3
MAGDGLIYHFLQIVHPRTKTPVYATLLSGIFAATLAMIFDITQLVHMISIGTLMAYTFVAICVLVLHYESPESSATHGHPSTTTIPVLMSTAYSSHTPCKLSAKIVKICVLIYCILATILAVLLLYEFAGFIAIGSVITCVCMLMVAVVIVCQPKNTADRPFFITPLVPWIPCITIFIDIYLMSKLPVVTWYRFVGWMAAGYLIYFTYGTKNAKVKKWKEEMEMAERVEELKSKRGGEEQQPKRAGEEQKPRRGGEAKGVQTSKRAGEAQKPQTPKAGRNADNPRIKFEQEIRKALK